MALDTSTSSPTERGRATARWAVRRMFRSAFAAIRRRLLTVTTASIFTWRSQTFVPPSASSRPSVPVYFFGEEVSGSTSTPTTPPSLSDQWNGSHLRSRYGIAQPFGEPE